MNYFDDILNVYAYLFSKAEHTADASRKLAQEAKRLDESLDDLNDQADDLLAETDDLLAQAYPLAAKLGVNTTGLSGGDAPELELPEPIAPVCADIRIPIPVNYDYHSQFQQLVQEAHDAGFTNVHPEELLTAEEMARAQEFSDNLDREFCNATRLQQKDLVVLTIAVAARVLIHFLSLKIGGSKEAKTEGPQILAPEKEPSAQTPPAVDAAPISVDAAQGVDIRGMLNTLSNHSDALQTGQQFASRISKNFSGPVRILDHATILDQDTPFDVQETDLFQRDDIVAYHKLLGWVVGTVNILTDTITTYGMKTYSVTRPAVNPGKPCVDREVSTFFAVVNPVVRSARSRKDSIAAAVVQEALTQGFGNASHEDVRTLFSRAMELEQRTSSFFDETKGLVKKFSHKWAAAIGDIAAIALVNTIVSAVHAMMYDESDGDLDLYSIRTNKIIACSGYIATLANSLPAIVSKDMTKLDFAGILTTCISLFQSNRFWIETKTAFLVNAYEQGLDRELDRLDRFFQY